MNRFDRYLRLVRWARKRYTRPDGYLITYERGMVPSTFTRIENAAAVKILGADRAKLGMAGAQP